jgi:hypothetical protein
MSNDVIMGVYYNTKKDVQRNRKMPSNEFLYISKWYDSITALNMNGVLLVDQSCDDEFINTNNSKNIRIIKRHIITDNPYEFDICILRFLDFLSFLEKEQFDNVLMTDVSDVFFKKNPFELFKEGHVCMQTEQYFNGQSILSNNSQWSLQAFSDAYGNNYPHWGKPLLNCGVIGARYHLCLEILRRFKDEAYAYKQKKGNSGGVHDMSFMNRIVNDYPIITGMPLHTIFKAYDVNNPNACVVHK